MQNVDLSAQIAAAYAANTANAALPCSQSFSTLDGKSVTTITGTHGLNVICVKDIVLGGKQILLTGPADAKFVFNITGKLLLTGGGLGPQIRVDTSAGLAPSAVLYNLIGIGADVAFSGGGGGVSCCAAIVDGTILASRSLPQDCAFSGPREWRSYFRFGHQHRLRLRREMPALHTSSSGGGGPGVCSKLLTRLNACGSYPSSAGVFVSKSL